MQGALEFDCDSETLKKYSAIYKHKQGRSQKLK